MTPAIVDIARHRGAFFQVLQETSRSQIAVMTIDPGADAGPEETHAGDQIVYVIEGEATVRIDGRNDRAAAGHCVLIPAGARHHVENAGATPLFFLTIYAPPVY
jgi:mannose-6-phosphate isomerase-like protein (cupin superfamily)